MTAGIALHGGGIAAATLAHLLAGEGVPVFGGETVPSAGPAPVVMLGAQAVALLHDVFQRPLFSAAHRIERRVVCWGGGDPVTVPHRALAISGADLAAALPQPVLAAGGADFAVHAAPPFPDDRLLSFGSRRAGAVAVDLAAGADEHAAVVEATEGGWLFLIPVGNRRAWLLSVGDQVEDQLAASRLRSILTPLRSFSTSTFETAPRMLQTLVGSDFLAIGHHALAFDPICGDGTATAVRAALLAAAVIAGRNEGLDEAALLSHYSSMLVAAMRRHLQVSLPFYRSGGTSPWWQQQADALAQGHAWCTQVLSRAGDPRFVLQGNRLIVREKAA
ncbi:MAG: hypothetical protein RIS94_839 [Pseudomonadota bacterium]|jgi:hypothetical protein